jgi:C-terminal peptidase prc
MRGLLLTLGCLLAAAWAMAAPRPTGPASHPPRHHAGRKAESRRFSMQLANIVDQVAASYYQPITRDKLFHAALAGMYESSRRPAPKDLQARIKKACDLQEKSLAKAKEPGPAIRPLLNNTGVGVATAIDSPLDLLIRSVHEDLVPSGTQASNRALVLCCRAIARILDPHSMVLTLEEQQQAMGLDTDYDGVGLEWGSEAGAGPIVIATVQLGSPAQRAGMRPGDRITHLDGKPVRQAPPPGLQALKYHRTPEPGAFLANTLDPTGAAPENAPVRVTFRRPGRKEAQTVSLTRERFHPETILGVSRREDNSWNYWADPVKRIAHLRVSALGRGSADDLLGTLTFLQEKGKLGGLILDLRWCPGGFLNEAVDVADHFLGKATIATVRTRGKEDTVYRSVDGVKVGRFPMVVLVNGATSGGAELVAAALQDHKRAVVAGQRTLGKASVQTPFYMGVPGGGALKVTSGTFIRPSGKNLHRFPESRISDDWGVQPNEEGDCRVSQDLSRRLAQWWLEAGLRPGGSRERIALDDPTADPQRLHALKLLEAMACNTVRAKGEQ